MNLVQTVQPTPAQLQEEMTQLASKLETRHSITFIAVSLIASFVGVIAFGVCMLLVAQSASLPHWLWPVLVLFVACLITAVVAGVKGRRLLEAERAKFAEFNALRAKLGFGA